MGARTKTASMSRQKFFRMGVYPVDEPDRITLFGPLFTNSAYDRDTMKQVIDLFNENPDRGPDLCCIASFRVKVRATIRK